MVTNFRDSGLASRGRLLLLSGPSGVGKTTVAAHLVSLPGFQRVVTATTRPPRSGERDGVHYHFVSREEFEEGIRSGRFLEHAQVYGKWYGTPREDIERGLAQCRWLVLTVDVQGARQIRERARDLPLTTIFILPPSLDELKRRLKERETETEKEIARRMELALKEMKEEALFDHKVVNESVDRAVERILQIIGQPERGEGPGKAQTGQTRQKPVE